MRTRCGAARCGAARRGVSRVSSRLRRSLARPHARFGFGVSIPGACPTPRLRTPKRRCRGVPCHAVAPAESRRADADGNVRQSASESARAEPSRACCTRLFARFRRGKWCRRKCACACDEIDGSVDEDRTPTTTTQQEEEEADDAIAPRPPPRSTAADRAAPSRPLIRRPSKRRRRIVGRRTECRIAVAGRPRRRDAQRGSSAGSCRAERSPTTTDAAAAREIGPPIGERVT